MLSTSSFMTRLINPSGSITHTAYSIHLRVWGLKVRVRIFFMVRISDFTLMLSTLLFMTLLINHSGSISHPASSVNLRI
jgi:hypothetical protein